MATKTNLHTTPAEVEVTTGMVATWAVSFAAAIAAAGAESISSCSAVLYTDMPPSPDVVVAGFVTDAQPSGTNANVSWTGAVLTKHSVYRLETKATLNTGAVIELLTIVRCVA